ncbi:uncharacterized protein LOC111281705 [Durio zibethinus]|uniref:Uncharacterized protein LOC111281705 n=1 Tax=Durio zibethinus TaxID=66656 RepID=A0A6P5XBV1_DURZI|nr:uncharacterized protein LOC111281705 [Durio zibethinus]
MASSALNQKSNFHARSNSLPSSSHPVIPQLEKHFLLQLPLAQKSIAQHCNDQQVNDLLKGSLRLLDVCGVAKDALLQAKEDTQELQSVVRRRRGDDASMLREVEGITITVFESLLSYIGGTTMQPKSTNWSLVSKLMHSNA